MLSNLFSRRAFAGRFASLVSGLGLAAATSAAAELAAEPKKTTGGPARTTVAVAALPGNSLVEINCTAAIVKK